MSRASARACRTASTDERHPQLRDVNRSLLVPLRVGAEAELYDRNRVPAPVPGCVEAPLAGFVVVVLDPRAREERAVDVERASLAACRFLDPVARQAVGTPLVE